MCTNVSCCALVKWLELHGARRTNDCTKVNFLASLSACIGTRCTVHPCLIMALFLSPSVWSLLMAAWFPKVWKFSSVFLLCLLWEPRCCLIRLIQRGGQSWRQKCMNRTETGQVLPRLWEAPEPVAGVCICTRYLIFSIPHSIRSIFKGRGAAGKWTPGEGGFMQLRAQSFPDSSLLRTVNTAWTIVLSENLENRSREKIHISVPQRHL